MRWPPASRIGPHLGRTIRLFCRSYALSFLKPSGAGKRLVVVKTDALGDQVLASCIFEPLRAIFRGHTIDIVVQTAARDFHESLGCFDSVIACDRDRYWKEPGYAAGLIRALRARRYSTALHAVYSRDIIGDQLTISAGARRVVGLSGDCRNSTPALKAVYDRRYTELIPAAMPGTFEGYRYLPILRHFGVAAGEDDWKPVARPGEKQLAEAARIMDALAIAPGRFAIVAPGAGDRMKCWGSAGFAAVADRLVSRRQLAVVVAGAPGEEDLADAVIGAMKSPARSITGKTSPLGLAALVARAAILVGNDSGPVHFAMAAGTPAVCVLGGGHFGRFLPYPEGYPLRCLTHRMECFHCNWECRHPEPFCITRVTAEEVWSAVADLLDGTASGKTRS